MKWLCYLLIVFSLLTSNVYSDELVQQEYMVDKIEKLLKEKPDHWYIRNDRLVYCEDKQYIAEIAKVTFPEVSAYADIVLSFQILRDSKESYIKFHKPDLGIVSERYEPKLFETLDKIIKVQLYKKLKTEVGSYIENLEEKPKEVFKEDPQEESGGLRKKL